MSFPFPFKFGFKGVNPQEELPKPEEVMGALTTFPPKISVLQSIPALPEAMFEKTVYDATGQTIPPGPNKMLASIMASIEEALPAPPALPGAAGKPQTSSELSRPQTSSELSQPSGIEAPAPKRRFELL